MAGKDTCFIKVNGDVIPCPAFYDLKDWHGGNIEKQKLEYIWRDDKTFDELRRFDYANLKGICGSCSHVNKCQGRCPAARARAYNNIKTGPDPACPAEYFQIHA